MIFISSFYTYVVISNGHISRIIHGMKLKFSGFSFGINIYKKKLGNSFIQIRRVNSHYISGDHAKNLLSQRGGDHAKSAWNDLVLSEPLFYQNFNLLFCIVITLIELERQLYCANVQYEGILSSELWIFKNVLNLGFKTSFLWYYF